MNILTARIKSLRRMAFRILIRVYRLIAGGVVDWICNLFLNFIERQSLPLIQDPVLLESAVSLAKKIRTKQVTCVSVVQAYIQRIQEVQPVINAVVEQRFNDALEEACHVDNLILSGEKTVQQLEKEFPLLGIPLSVKEAISVSGMLFTAGAVERKGVRASRDAEAVALLRKAGAIPIVVTNTSEQCFWMETYNNLYGRTNNPYDSRRTAGGSSGGEGALLAAAGSLIGIGNDIGGSIRIPACFNGVFGHKPSSGIVCNDGHFPHTELVLQPFIGTGPMSRYASDLRLMLKVMADDKAPEYRLNKKFDIRSLKVFYMDDNGGDSCTSAVSPDIKEALSQVIEHFRKTCDVPPQKVQIKHLKYGFRVWAHALSPVVTKTPRVGDLVLGKSSLFRALFELVKCFFGLSDHTFPILVTIIIDEILGPTKESHAAPFIAIQKKLEQSFQSLLQDNCVFLMPTMPEPAPFHYVSCLRAPNCGYVALFNILGLPATHCPLRLNADGLPIGLQIISGMKNDYLNLAVAEELEAMFGGWTCPAGGV